ncbi:hypothetical protein ACFFRR_007689 [Megaselia abdita]
MEISFENVEPTNNTRGATSVSTTTTPQNTILPSLTYSTLTLKKSSANNNMETGGLCGNGNGNGNGNNPPSQPSIHHSNIILLRGARAENGQIILQNRQDLLSLLNDDSNNSIVIQQAKLKTGQTTNASSSSAGTTTNLPTVKTVIADDGMNGMGQGATILLQTPIQESWNAKLKKSAGCQMSSTATTTTTSVPFLLQTIKRLDNKSQSILVFRNSSTAGAPLSSNKSTTTTNSKVTTINGTPLTFTTTGGDAKIHKGISITRTTSTSSSSSSTNNNNSKHHHHQHPTNNTKNNQNSVSLLDDVQNKDEQQHQQQQQHHHPHQQQQQQQQQPVVRQRKQKLVTIPIGVGSPNYPHLSKKEEYNKK